MRKAFVKHLVGLTCGIASTLALAVPNPAASLCSALGGKPEILKEQSTQNAVGYCRFQEPANAYLAGLVEEWTLYNEHIHTKPTKAFTLFHGRTWPPTTVPSGQHPALQHCLQVGGKRVDYVDVQGNQVGGCRFDDGSELEEWTLFRGASVHTAVPL